MVIVSTAESGERASDLARAIESLVDEYRAKCLWYLRADYYPVTDEERLRILSQIERHADREGFRRAGRLRQWLSQRSSATSAAS
jgi:hypothetical protein